MGSSSLRQHKKRRAPTQGAVEVSNRGQPEEGSPVSGGTVNVVSAVVTPRPPLHSNDLEGGVAMAGPERVVVDLTNDSGVEDEAVVDLTSSIQHIPPISGYIGSMGLGFPLHVTAGPPFQEGYTGNRPSCLYATLPVQLVESDEEVEEVNTTSEGLLPPKHPRGIPAVSHEGSATPASSQGSRPRTSVSCPICLETVEQFEKSGRQLVTTVCGHVFCNVCVRNSISRQHACPTCRKKLTLKQYHPLFL